MNKLELVSITAGCALLGAIGQLFFKLGSATSSLNISSLILNWQIVLGIFFYAVATISFILILKKADLSLLYPIVATSYIWVAIFSLFLLKEKLFLYNWLGILLIIGGVYLTSKKQ